MDSEEKIRHHVHALKVFYTNILIYICVCCAAFIVWLSMGCGPFWPIWVILGCGVSTSLQAMNLGKFPKLYALFPFLEKNWENEQVQEIMKKSLKIKKS